MKNLIFLLLICQLLLSCKTTADIDANSTFYTKEIISTISQKEEISSIKNFSYFHVKIEKLNTNHYLFKISFNNLKPKKYSDAIKYLGYDIYLYKDLAIKELDESTFFVPDSKSWDFIMYCNNKEIFWIRQLTDYKEIPNAPYRSGEF
ncbi:hypothetical protein D3C87_42100 [compost metagenome]